MKPDSGFDSKDEKTLGREIEALFSVDPSPEYLVRVRARIEHAPDPALGLGRWIFAVGAIAAAILGVFILTSKHQFPRATEQVASSTVAEQPAPVPANHTSEDQFSKVQKGGPRPPEVLIEEGETAALQRLMNGPLIQLPAGFSEPSMTEIQIHEIEIMPLEIPAPISIEAIEQPPDVVDGKGGL